MNKLTHTVREVKVIHIPPKPLKVKAMKIKTDRSRKNKQMSWWNIIGICYNIGICFTKFELSCIDGVLTIWVAGSISNHKAWEGKAGTGKEKVSY